MQFLLLNQKFWVILQNVNNYQADLVGLIGNMQKEAISEDGFYS